MKKWVLGVILILAFQAFVQAAVSRKLTITITISEPTGAQIDSIYSQLNAFKNNNPSLNISIEKFLAEESRDF